MTPEQIAAGRVALDKHLDTLISQASMFERGALRSFLTEDLRNQFVTEVGEAVLAVPKDGN